MTSGREFHYKSEGESITVNLTEELLMGIIDNIDDHYREARIPKRSGGFRTLLIPSDLLKALQKYVLTRIRAFGKHKHAHGFIKGKDIKSNATEHKSARLLMHTDIRNFFPSISPDILRRNFTKRKDMRIFLGTKTEEFIRFVTFRNHCPQGAPTSPTIGNIVMRPIDAAIQYYLVDGVGLRYTRYADDLILSCRHDNRDLFGLTPSRRVRLQNMTKDDMWRYMHWIAKLTRRYGFQVHWDKTYVIDDSRSMRVTGFVVNEKVNVSKTQVNNIKAHTYVVAQMVRNNEEGAMIEAARLRARLAFLARSEGRNITGSWKAMIEEIQVATNITLMPERFRERPVPLTVEERANRRRGTSRPTVNYPYDAF